MIILRAEVEQIPNPSAPSSPQTLLSGLCASAKSNVAPLRSCRRQGNAPPAVKKSPLKKAISKFGVRAQHTVLMRITHASPSSQKSFLRKYFCEVLLFFHFIMSGEAGKAYHPCYNLWRKQNHAFAQRAPICQPFGFCGKVSRWGLSCCQSHRRGKPNAEPHHGERWGFLNLTDFLFVSSKRKS